MHGIEFRLRIYRERRRSVREILLDSTLPHVCAVDDTSCRVNDESTVVLIAPPLAVERLRRDASDALDAHQAFRAFRASLWTTSTTPSTASGPPMISPDASASSFAR